MFVGAVVRLILGEELTAFKTPAVQKSPFPLGVPVGRNWEGRYAPLVSKTHWHC